MTVAECLFTSRKGVFPGWVGLVTAGGNRYEIFDRASEDAFRWGEFCGRIGSIAILKDCNL